MPVSSIVSLLNLEDGWFELGFDGEELVGGLAAFELDLDGGALFTPRIVYLLGRGVRQLRAFLPQLRCE